jgi:hypothetical protein
MRYRAFVGQIVVANLDVRNGEVADQNEALAIEQAIARHVIACAVQAEIVILKNTSPRHPLPVIMIEVVK